MFCAFLAHKIKTSSFDFTLQSSSLGFFLLFLNVVRFQEFVSAHFSVDVLLNEDGTLKEFDFEINDDENLEEIEFISEADEQFLKHLVCFNVTPDSNTTSDKLDSSFVSFIFLFSVIPCVIWLTLTVPLVGLTNNKDANAVLQGKKKSMP